MRLNRLVVTAILLSLGVILFTGCALLPPKNRVATMAEEYSVITGVLVAPAELKNGQQRLIVYFNEQTEKVEEKTEVMRDANGEVVTDTDGEVVAAPNTPNVADKNVLMCVTENAQNKRVLINLRAYLNDPKAQGKTIFIYGTLLPEGNWKEYLSGVHCTITAIGFYVPTTGSYTYVMTEFGNGVWDNFSWTEFIKKIGSKAIDKAI